MTQRYDTYKDSGVQWLGEIPGHWGLPAFKRVCKLKSGNTNVEEITNGDVPFVRVSDMNIPENKLYIETSKTFVDRKNCINSIFPTGSIIFPKRGGAILTNKRRIVKKEICCDLNIMGAIPGEKVNSLFLYYYLLSKDFGILYNGSAVPQINNGDIEPLLFPLPPLSEQCSIVSYLDAKCGKIDEWVTKKQKEVEHLQELKQRVIADAVTRGLNPHVKMKATNIPWLKEIPEHWEMRKMKYLFDERSEKNHPNEPMLSATQSEGVILQSKYQGRVVVVNTGFEGLKLVKVGDFVIHLRSFQGGIEYAHYRGIISSAYTILNPKYPEYSAYYKRLFKSSSFIDLLKICVTGIREGQNINYSKLKQFSIPVPPLSEQKQIVSYLDAKCSKIDKLIANITKEIERIKEYKQRLISDVVTGQIKVC